MKTGGSIIGLEGRVATVSWMGVEQISPPAGNHTDLSAFLDRLIQMQQQQQHHTQLMQQVMGQMQLRTAGQVVMPVPGQQQVGLPLLNFQ